MSVYACESCQDMFDDDYAEHLCENDMFCNKCDERIFEEREAAKDTLPPDDHNTYPNLQQRL